MRACIARSLYGETKIGFRIEPLHLHRLADALFGSANQNISFDKIKRVRAVY